MSLKGLFKIKGKFILKNWTGTVALYLNSKKISYHEYTVMVKMCWKCTKSTNFNNYVKS